MRPNSPNSCPSSLEFALTYYPLVLLDFRCTSVPLQSINMFFSDAARLARVCKRLRDIVRQRSAWPRFARGGAVLPPLSGNYHVTVSPAGGWAGLKSALASCPEGGSVLAEEGEYIYGPGDLEQKVFEKGAERHHAALVISSPLHLFGHGKAILRPADAPPFWEWGIDRDDVAECILSTASRGTLNGLSIEAPRGKDDGDLIASMAAAADESGPLDFAQAWPVHVYFWGKGALAGRAFGRAAVAIVGGGLRLQSCEISVSDELDGMAVLALGPTSKPAVVGCQLSGGENTVWWDEGALGRLEVEVFT